MPPSTKLWPLPAQTIGKHIVLRAYLGAWLGILGQGETRLVFVDGYAGPGEYEGGQPGSPLIALDVFENHAAQDRFTAKMVFLFLEQDHARCAHLKGLVDPIATRIKHRADVLVRPERFDVGMADLLDKLESKGSGLAPAFVMVDPFGVSHLPMALMRRILSNAKAEVFVSFMYEAINRHHAAPEFEQHLDELFGTRQWREMDQIANSEDRKRFVLDLYEAQLRSARAEYVTRFELWNGSRFVYAIYFATGSALACNRMKQAVWSADPTGDFQFRSDRIGQISLFGADFGQLERQIREVFGGKQVSLEAVQTWIQTDKTQFHSGQLRAALRSMETQGLLTVTDGTRKRKGTFPGGTRFTIKST